MIDNDFLFPYLKVDKDRAKQCFDRAVERGLMTINENNLYRWNVDKYSKTLFAYFIGRLCGDTVKVEYKNIYDNYGKIKRRKKVLIWVQSGSVFQWIIRVYFRINASQQRWNKNSLNQHAPKGAEIIEEILDF